MLAELDTSIIAMCEKEKKILSLFLVDQGPILIQVCVKYVNKNILTNSCLNYASFLYF